MRYDATCDGESEWGVARKQPPAVTSCDVMAIARCRHGIGVYSAAQPPRLLVCTNITRTKQRADQTDPHTHLLLPTPTTSPAVTAPVLPPLEAPLT